MRAARVGLRSCTTASETAAVRSHLAIDAYNETIGTIPQFLGPQIALSGGMDAANC